MANQPTPIRPWFRLASIRAPPPPAPAPTAEPRPPPARPTFRALAPTSTQPLPPTNIAPPTSARPATPPAVETPAAAPPPAPAVTLAPSVGTTGNAESVPSSPDARVSAPSASLPTSPVPRAVRSTNSVPTSPAPKPAQANGGAKQPLKPKNADETPPQSPKVKLTARPPSPLTLPPSQLMRSKEESDQPKIIPGEPEPKTVLVQKTIEKPKSSYNGNGEFRNSGEVRKFEHVRDEKREASKEVETKDGSTHRKVSVSEDGGPRIIILAGENKGAVMDLIQSSSKKHGIGTIPNRLHEKGTPSIKSTGGRQWDTCSSSSNEDENVKKKDKSHEGKTKASPPWIAYMNSNVQGINNSIMYHSKCHHKDPGIHLVRSRKPFSEKFQLMERIPDHHD